VDKHFGLYADGRRKGLAQYETVSIWEDAGKAGGLTHASFSSGKDELS